MGDLTKEAQRIKSKFQLPKSSAWSTSARRRSGDGRCATGEWGRSLAEAALPLCPGAPTFAFDWRQQAFVVSLRSPAFHVHRVPYAETVVVRFLLTIAPVEGTER